MTMLESQSDSFKTEGLDEAAGPFTQRVAGEFTDMTKNESMMKSEVVGLAIVNE